MRQLDEVKAQLEQLKQWRTSVDEAAPPWSSTTRTRRGLLAEAMGGLQTLKPSWIAGAGSGCSPDLRQERLL